MTQQSIPPSQSSFIVTLKVHSIAERHIKVSADSEDEAGEIALAKFYKDTKGWGVESVDVASIISSKV